MAQDNNLHSKNFDLDMYILKNVGSNHSFTRSSLLAQSKVVEEALKEFFKKRNVEIDE